LFTAAEMTANLQRAGFEVEQIAEREPYAFEYQSRRVYIWGLVARYTAAAILQHFQTPQYIQNQRDRPCQTGRALAGLALPNTHQTG
jgi:hypothetical protein